jgi:hypothetical protein
MVADYKTGRKHFWSAYIGLLSQKIPEETKKNHNKSSKQECYHSTATGLCSFGLVMQG